MQFGKWKYGRDKFGRPTKSLNVKRLKAGSYVVRGTDYFFYRADLYGAEVSEDGISNRGLWYIYRVVGWHDQFVDAAGSFAAAKAAVIDDMNRKEA